MVPHVKWLNPSTKNNKKKWVCWIYFFDPENFPKRILRKMTLYYVRIEAKIIEDEPHEQSGAYTRISFR